MMHYVLLVTGGSLHNAPTIPHFPD